MQRYETNLNRNRNTGNDRRDSVSHLTGATSLILTMKIMTRILMKTLKKMTIQMSNGMRMTEISNGGILFQVDIATALMKTITKVLAQKAAGGVLAEEAPPTAVGG